MNKYTKELMKLADKDYAAFSHKITPNVEQNKFLGVRVPIVRKLAKTLYNVSDADSFFNELPHNYFDENMLHGLLIEQIKDYDECVKQLDKFLPFVDNWAVCDSCNPKVFKKNKDKLIKDINRWIKAKDTYTVRFAINMLMGHYLDDDFDEKYLKQVSKVKSNEYYINMVVAWYFATALAKQYDSTIPYIENKVLDDWTHNKTIQKAIESYRISDSQKQYLRTLKIK